jgi:glycosyltransferase involved in cell wall biosynthesis
MTIVESLVGGTPVIVADSEEKPDPYSHCIITKESEIANKIADVMNSDVMVDSERIGQMYNWEKLTKELVDVYKS